MRTKKKESTWIVNLALSIAGKIQLHKLNKASKDCASSQEKTLRSILEYAKDTEWGRLHNFEEILRAGSREQLITLWKRNVPPTDYEDIRLSVERHKNGESNILFPGKPLMYATTSGTTSEPKWIPITKEYYKNIYSKMTKLWLYTFIMHRAKVFQGKVVSIVGKAIEGASPDGTVYGSVSGVTQRDCPEFVKKIYSAPSAVFRISDYKARYYTIMRMGIEYDVGLIVTANPSTIVEMQNNVNEFYDDYVKDIRNGTLNETLSIDEDIRKELAPYFIPNPKRAEELEKLKKQYGNVLPKHYWPNLQVLNTWKCGNTKVYLDKFKDSFANCTLHQEFGYFASECRAGLVMNGKNDTVLFPHMHFFEFVSEADMESASPKFYQLTELEEGKRYCIYVTTWAGLYRYNMNDLIEVTGKYGTIPTIQFVQKVNGIVTMTGEKLHERQFIEAIHQAEKETGLRTKFFVGFADLELSAYHFYYEFDERNVVKDSAESFTKIVDDKLKQMNCEYEAKRASFRVKDPVTHLLCKDSFETYKARCIAMGARDGQFKMNLLLQDEKRRAMFQELVVG